MHTDIVLKVNWPIFSLFLNILFLRVSCRFSWCGRERTRDTERNTLYFFRLHISPIILPLQHFTWWSSPVEVWGRTQSSSTSLGNSQSHWDSSPYHFSASRSSLILSCWFVYFLHFLSFVLVFLSSFFITSIFDSFYYFLSFLPSIFLSFFFLSITSFLSHFLFLFISLLSFIHSFFLFLLFIHSLFFLYFFSSFPSFFSFLLLFWKVLFCIYSLLLPGIFWVFLLSPGVFGLILPIVLSVLFHVVFLSFFLSFFLSPFFFSSFLTFVFDFFLSFFLSFNHQRFLIYRNNNYSCLFKLSLTFHYFCYKWFYKC